MAEQRIIVTIDDLGEISAETQGFMGAGCLEELEKILGEVMEPKKIVKKDEYDQKQKVVQDKTLKTRRS